VFLMMWRMVMVMAGMLAQTIHMRLHDLAFRWSPHVGVDHYPTAFSTVPFSKKSKCLFGSMVTMQLQAKFYKHSIGSTNCVDGHVWRHWVQQYWRPRMGIEYVTWYLYNLWAEKKRGLTVVCFLYQGTVYLILVRLALSNFADDQVHSVQPVHK
jgi:hypothetical protein